MDEDQRTENLNLNMILRRLRYISSENRAGIYLSFIILKAIITIVDVVMSSKSGRTRATGVQQRQLQVSSPGSGEQA
jgi:hypothetical protein